MIKTYLHTTVLIASLASLWPSGAYAEAAEHAAKAGMPQLDPTWFASQLFWLVITFGVLYGFFSKKFLPTLSNILENRHNHIQGDLDQAEHIKKEAEKVRAAYEEILNEAHVKSSNMFIDAEESIKAKAEKSLDGFRDKSTKDIEETDASIQAAKAEAMEEMHTIAAEIASEAAQKIVGIRADVDQAKTVIQNMSNKKAA